MYFFLTAFRKETARKLTSQWNHPSFSLNNAILVTALTKLPPVFGTCMKMNLSSMTIVSPGTAAFAARSRFERRLRRPGILANRGGAGGPPPGPVRAGAPAARTRVRHRPPAAASASSARAPARMLIIAWFPSWQAYSHISPAVTPRAA